MTASAPPKSGHPRRSPPVLAHFSHHLPIDREGAPTPQIRQVPTRSSLPKSGRGGVPGNCPCVASTKAASVSHHPKGIVEAIFDAPSTFSDRPDPGSLSPHLCPPTQPLISISRQLFLGEAEVHSARPKHRQEGLFEQIPTNILPSRWVERVDI